MIKKTVFAAAAALLLSVGQAGAATIDFEDLAEGTVLSNQYAGLGVVFSPNAFAGAGRSSSGMSWASNTDMAITNIDTGSVGGLGYPSLVSGNILHAFGDGPPATNWQAEDGDPSFLITFTTPVSFISIDFAGVRTIADGGFSGAPDVHLIAYNGTTQLADITFDEVNHVNLGQYTLSYAGALITSVAVTPGSYDDWVGVDNIVFAPVPEASTYAMMALGMGLIAFKRRKAA